MLIGACNPTMCPIPVCRVALFNSAPLAAAVTIRQTTSGAAGKMGGGGERGTTSGAGKGGNALKQDGYLRLNTYGNFDIT